MSHHTWLCFSGYQTVSVDGPQPQYPHPKYKDPRTPAHSSRCPGHHCWCACLGSSEAQMNLCGLPHDCPVPTKLFAKDSHSFSLARTRCFLLCCAKNWLALSRECGAQPKSAHSLPCVNEDQKTMEAPKLTHLPAVDNLLVENPKFIADSIAICS